MHARLIATERNLPCRGIHASCGSARDGAARVLPAGATIAVPDHVCLLGAE